MRLEFGCGCGRLLWGFFMNATHFRIHALVGTVLAYCTVFNRLLPIFIRFRGYLSPVICVVAIW